MDVVAYTTILPGGMDKAYFGVGDAWYPQIWTRALFESSVAFSIDDLRLGLVDVPAGVPEPASWAMLIGGFGLAGANLRRRGRAIA
jgi:hypothetical protein